MNKEKMMNNIIELAKSDYCKELNELSPAELHYVVGKAVMGEISDKWNTAKKNHASKRRAYYFSAEFLMGRMMYNNLFNMGILDEVKDMLAEKGIDINVFEEVDDTALGNGGLGRTVSDAVFNDPPLLRCKMRDFFIEIHEKPSFPEGIVRDPNYTDVKDLFPSP